MAKDQWAKIELRNTGKLTLVARKSFLSATQAVVLKSPFDKSIFRNNWFTEINSISSKTTEASGTGSARLAEASNKAKLLSAGDSISFVNRLPYGPFLEDGGSQQAKEGIIKVVASEWKYTVAKIARDIKNDK